MLANTAGDIIDAAAKDPQIAALLFRYSHTMIGSAIGSAIAWAVIHNYLPPLPASVVDAICAAGAALGTVVAEYARRWTATWMAKGAISKVP